MFMLVFGFQNAFFLFSGLFPGHFFLDFSHDFSTFGASESLFSHVRYSEHRLLMEIDFKKIGIEFQCFMDASGTAFLVFWALKTGLKT